MTTPTWLHLDELENAVDNLQMVAHFLTTIGDQRKWKWAIIALHQALYGFLISALTGTDGRLLVRANPRRPKGREVIGIWEALDRMKERNSFPWDNAQPLILTPTQESAIKWLVNDYRNEFEHFEPKSWLIETSGMPWLFLQVLEVIDHVAIHSNAVAFHDNLENTTKESLASLRQLLAQVAAAQQLDGADPASRMLSLARY